MRSELDIYAEMTLKRGGVWYRIDEKNGYSVYNTGYTTAVYQIYNTDGKRVFASTSFTETMEKFRRMTKYKAP